jgi:hypothetical protein
VAAVLIANPADPRDLEGFSTIAGASIPRSLGYASMPAFGAAFRETFGSTPAMAAPRSDNDPSRQLVQRKGAVSPTSAVVVRQETD